MSLTSVNFKVIVFAHVKHTNRQTECNTFHACVSSLLVIPDALFFTDAPKGQIHIELALIGLSSYMRPE